MQEVELLDYLSLGFIIDLVYGSTVVDAFVFLHDTGELKRALAYSSCPVLRNGRVIWNIICSHFNKRGMQTINYTNQAFRKEKVDAGTVMNMIVQLRNLLK